MGYSCPEYNILSEYQNTISTRIQRFVRILSPCRRNELEPGGVKRYSLLEVFTYLEVQSKHIFGVKQVFSHQTIKSKHIFGVKKLVVPQKCFCFESVLCETVFSTPNMFLL